ncbi:YggS family pyridoxal phosphate-dependent enzyme [Arcanobacterium ihumii]|uniref:YggS family pyridoxal phosphate-dependent enzyme n=1 Tax=Arcanobacterium ihumii TaxID=2138162 RepID=UPI000F540862|nr:YggS family pyridoxal phosphate-dependent enzyme [Arcanobacterium ihumii]
MTTIDIEGNIAALRERMAEAAVNNDRDPHSVKLMLAAKYQPLENLIRAIECGETLFGHNLINQLEDSESALRFAATKMPSDLSHRTTVIGHVQSNKLSTAMEYAQRIDTVDSLKNAKRINRRQEAKVESGETSLPYPILLQVNSSGAQTQFGCDPKDLLELAAHVASLPFVSVEGLMTIGANSSDPMVVDRSFEITQSLLTEMKKIAGLENASELSMGMTNDVENAIKYGSTVVRVGTAIFGPRQTTAN